MSCSKLKPSTTSEAKTKASDSHRPRGLGTQAKTMACPGTRSTDLEAHWSLVVATRGLRNFNSAADINWLKRN